MRGLKGNCFRLSAWVHRTLAFSGRRLAGDSVSSVTDRSLQKKHRWQAASHSPWSQQDSGITLSTSMGMIGVLEITLIVPTLRVGMPL
ncbi:hypothetical protein, partial [Pseudomonas viridiflava]|uniref:hypothetical protein n=1 Tax=Pseudomonas viridiflava TaxID=33069 RepID=UPI00197D4644